MHNRISKVIFTAFCGIFLCGTMAVAADKILSLVSSIGLDTIEVTAGDSIIVDVTIDDATVVAGASFTIKYDTASLSLTNVESTFFDTFANQNIPTPNDQGYVTVDAVDYYRPLIHNTVSGLSAPVTTGSMLAAAKVDNGTGINVTIFTLTFDAIGTSGVFPLSISQSIINNVDAGYAAGGETIPYLVGIDSASSQVSYPTHDNPTLNGCTVVVNPAFVDLDLDGIDDNWELANIPPETPAGQELTVFSATGDYDQDGYSDKQEYLNRTETDPAGGIYDPRVQNAPNGTGYIPVATNAGFLPAIFQLLLFEK